MLLQFFLTAKYEIDHRQVYACDIKYRQISITANLGCQKMVIIRTDSWHQNTTFWDKSILLRKKNVDHVELYIYNL